jgi:hypothetical protein
MTATHQAVSQQSAQPNSAESPLAPGQPAHAMIWQPPHCCLHCDSPQPRCLWAYLHAASDAVSDMQPREQASC